MHQQNGNSVRLIPFCNTVARNTVAVNAIIFEILAFLLFLFVMDLIAPCVDDFTQNVSNDTNNECTQADVNFLSS